MNPASGAPIGVLVMAYGTASGPDDVERYYTDIRGGRPPAPEHLRVLLKRYAAIGNRFPLSEITRQQAEGLERTLNAEGDGRVFRSYVGMKHSPPFIPEAVARMRDDGIERGVGVVMAPHWSGMSVETYAERALAAAGEDGPELTFVKHWYDHPSFVELLASRVQEALGTLEPSNRSDAVVIFSAHSLPQRALDDGSTRCLRCDLCPEGCRYSAQLHLTGELVAERLGLTRWVTGWQSAGRTADPWLGPPMEAVIEGIAETGAPAVVVCSAGFVADHLEILYDLDIEARRVTEGAGLAFARTRMPNADPLFVEALAAVVKDHLAAFSVP